jgi:tetratricopeptide (TPR) repeat protein
MLKPYFIILFSFLTVNSNATLSNIKPDNFNNLNDILQLKDQNLRERKLTKYIEVYFENIQIDSFNTAKTRLDGLLFKNNIENQEALDCFIQSFYYSKLSRVNEAEFTLLKAIELAEKNSDHYLLYSFFTYLAIIQNNIGNTIAAISSYRLANKEAMMMGDSYLQILLDINISDMFYRNSFYDQSLRYLDQAMAIIVKNRVDEQRLKNAIYFNKAENYFRMNEIDSLTKYNKSLNDARSGTNKLYTFRNRTSYYLDLLQHNYNDAIKRIKILQKDTLYQFDNFDKINLADAYYYVGNPDSAKNIIEQLLAGETQNNHSEIKSHLYDVLGKISEAKQDYKTAASNFKLALQQSENSVTKLTQVGNISSQIKIDEMEDAYLQKETGYQKEQLWLILVVILAVFIIIIVALSYKSIKQKRRYENLLYKTKKQELAFLNSHDVRKHLTNILGIIDVLKHSENKKKEYLQVEDRLFYSAEKLDESIKNISNKLDE